MDSSAFSSILFGVRETWRASEPLNFGEVILLASLSPAHHAMSAPAAPAAPDKGPAFPSLRSLGNLDDLLVGAVLKAGSPTTGASLSPRSPFVRG